MLGIMGNSGKHGNLARSSRFFYGVYCLRPLVLVAGRVVKEAKTPIFIGS
jgi:hypothetical protein